MREDREKWDKKYLENDREHSGPDEFLVKHVQLFSGGKALDLACGTGRNAIYLASKNYSVDAIDISPVAIKKLSNQAERAGLAINVSVGDLDVCTLPNEYYDLIIVFYFYLESCISELKKALKTDGLLVYATYNTNHLRSSATFNPMYLVEPNELAGLFRDFQTIVNEPAAGELGNISRLICRKP